MMAKDLKIYLNKDNVKNIIINDFKNELDIDIIDLSIKSISDNVAILQSNLLDSKLGVFSNTFAKLSINFDIKTEKKNDEEYWFVKPYFSFVDKKGVNYKTEVFSKEDLLIDFYYKYKNDRLELIPRKINNGFTRILFNFNNGENKKYYYIPILDLLTIRGICRKIYNCISFSIEVYKEGVWETIIIDKEDLISCINSLEKNSTSKVKYIH